MTRHARAELLLDTDRVSAGLGTRAVAIAPRQLVFRPGPHQLEVLAPASRAPGAARFVWGQLLSGVESPCADTGIAWLDGAGTVCSETTTDEFGEFRLAAPAEEGGLRVSAEPECFICWVPPARSDARSDA